QVTGLIVVMDYTLITRRLEWKAATEFAEVDEIIAMPSWQPVDDLHWPRTLSESRVRPYQPYGRQSSSIGISSADARISMHRPFGSPEMYRPLLQTPPIGLLGDLPAASGKHCSSQRGDRHASGLSSTSTSILAR